MSRGRAWHLGVAVLATAAVVFQLVLVWQGGTVLDETDPPDLGERVIRFFGYFTVLSNILVAWVAWTIALDRDTDTAGWRTLRLTSLVAITVTGVVHWFLLRPLLDLSGADYLADKLLHLAVPLVAVIGWAVFGPRGRVQGRDVVASLAFPVVWLSYTLLRGAITGFYPYPFLDVDAEGYAAVSVVSLGIAVLFVGVAAVAWKGDERVAKRQ
ncbi:Pr6Pr family membrane protein [Nocardioides sp.]|uniref:Pr6Pr family membrane protein n=1 Tax=Nocardioides sp. TaxID=35761 RepID=UPI002B6B3A0B|nr:Pr6Pr family membrane protein [Nocardioides sp.]HXH80019.1 Pr6Pr family membrane protein [Nocardioides sp.]